MKKKPSNPNRNRRPARQPDFHILKSAGKASHADGRDAGCVRPGPRDQNGWNPDFLILAPDVVKFKEALSRLHIRADRSEYECRMK
jgi:hypothetical protein